MTWEIPQGCFFLKDIRTWRRSLFHFKSYSHFLLVSSSGSPQAHMDDHIMLTPRGFTLWTEKKLKKWTVCCFRKRSLQFYFIYFYCNGSVWLKVQRPPGPENRRCCHLALHSMGALSVQEQVIWENGKMSEWIISSVNAVFHIAAAHNEHRCAQGHDGH